MYFVIHYIYKLFQLIVVTHFPSDLFTLFHRYFLYSLADPTLLTRKGVIPTPQAYSSISPFFYPIKVASSSRNYITTSSTALSKDKTPSEMIMNDVTHDKHHTSSDLSRLVSGQYQCLNLQVSSRRGNTHEREIHNVLLSLFKDCFVAVITIKTTAVCCFIKTRTLVVTNISLWFSKFYKSAFRKGGKSSVCCLLFDMKKAFNTVFFFTKL